MAINQQPVQRQILTPESKVSAGSGFDSLGAAATQLATAASNMASDVAIEEASQQGAADVEAGTQPKSLAPGLTAATKSYNNAVSSSEANRMIESGRNQIEEAFIRSTDPATFNSNTPAQFRAELMGITQGTVENARPQTREKVLTSLNSMSSTASMKMLSHSIAFDNKKTVDDFSFDIDNYSRDRKNASILGDTNEVERIDGLIKETTENYSAQSEQIKSLMPKINKQLIEQKQVDGVLADYAKATTEEKPQFMADLLQNKNNLPFDTLKKASTELLQLKNTDSALKHDVNAQDVSIVNDGITTGRINNADQILNFNNLNVSQKLHAMSELEVHKNKINASQNKILTAQKDILFNRSAQIPDKTKKEMFDVAIGQLEKQKGAPASLADMSQSILGTNAYPVSGLSNTAMKTNVPSFDSVMDAALTSRDPVAMAQASMVFNNMAKISGQPNSVNISGKALSVATLFNTLNKGDITPEKAAELTTNAVLDADAPEVKERSDRFRSTLSFIDKSTGKSKLDKSFKETFGTKTRNFQTDSAFNLFKDTYRAHYLQSNSEEAALSATKYAMRSYGTSKYFDEGMVASPVPEKELTITKVGNTFENQMNIGLQGVIKRNEELRNNGVPVSAIEWSDKKSTINLANLSDESKVMDSLGAGSEPRIKIDGHESKVVLIPGPDSKLGDRLTYNYGYYDQFNMLHTLPDESNTIGHTAQFSPVGLEQWAPGIFEEKNQDRLTDIAKKMQHQGVVNVMTMFKEQSDSPLMKNVPVALMTKAFEMIAGDGDPKKIVDLLKQKIQKKEKPADEMVDADVVSVKDNN